MIHQDFYIVGISASAGENDSLKEFFSHIPKRPGACFVVMQQAEPLLLAQTQEWLATYCQLSLQMVRQDVEVQPDWVYLVPADKGVQLQEGRLVLHHREQKQVGQPATSTFFESLGQQLKQKAVRVILAGTGSEEHLGGSAIARNGGLVLMQHPEKSEIRGIPNTDGAVADTGTMLPAERLAKALLHHIQQPHNPGKAGPGEFLYQENPFRQPEQLQVTANYIVQGQQEDYAHMVVGAVAPPAILLNQQNEVVYTYGNVRQYLQIPVKTGSQNVFHMVCKDLYPIFRNGLQLVSNGKVKVEYRNVMLEKQEQPLHVDLYFKKVPAGTNKQKLILVNFREPALRVAAGGNGYSFHQNETFLQTKELRLKKEEQREEVPQTVHGTDTSQKPQDLYEELQATKAELKIKNKELRSLKAELQDKTTELSVLHQDISNLQDCANMAIFFLDEKLHIRTSTPAARALPCFKGSDSSNPLTQLPEDFMYPHFTADALKVQETQQPMEREAKDANGNWYMVRLLPYKTERMKQKGVVVTCTDVTQLKRISSDLQIRSLELEESDRSCRSLVNNSPDLIARYDRNQAYTYINTALEKHLHKPASEILGKLNAALTIPDDQQQKAHWSNQIQEAFSTKEPGHSYFICTEGQGQKHYYTSFIPEFDQDGGQVQSVLTISRDVTKLMHHEALIAKQNKELSKMNSDLDNFVYTASHDLKAPILNIEGLTSVLSEKLSEGAIGSDDKLLEMIRTSIAKFKIIISDLIDISKAQHNFQHEEEHISFRQVLQEVEAEIRPLILESGAVIAADFEVEHIKYARYHLRCILSNLLTNAILYRSGKPVEISIRTRREGDAVVLLVSDNGLGIKPSHVPEVFKMFKRFHDHVEGSGVGLYIVKRIIENNGGKIEMESNLNQGTSLKVVL